MLKLIHRVFGFIAVPGALALAGCATVLPSGPDVVGVPSAGKDVAQTRQPAEATPGSKSVLRSASGIRSVSSSATI